MSEKEASDQQTEKKQKVGINNIVFWIVLLLVILSIIATIALIIYYFYAGIKNNEPVVNPCDYLGVICQIITSICLAALSILQISFSIQDNSILGITGRTLYKMRSKKYFPFAFSFFIAMIYIIISVIGYVIGSPCVCVISAVCSILFCAYIICNEVPYLYLDEKVLFNTIQNRLKAEYNGPIKADDYQTVEVGKALEAIIENKNIKWTYKKLSIKNNNQFNKALFLRLVDAQNNAALHLNQIDSFDKLSNATDVLLETACSITDSSFGFISTFSADELKGLTFKITQIFFCLIANKEAREKTEDRISLQIANGWIQSRDDDKTNSIKSDFFVSVMTIVVIGMIKVNDFSLLKNVQKQLSSKETNLLLNENTARIFIMISFVLFYLAKKENNVPIETKSQIQMIVENSYDESNYRVLSWKQLFRKFGEKYIVTLEEFLNDFARNGQYYEFQFYDNQAREIIFTRKLAIKWYLFTYLNFAEKLNTDYKTLFKLKDEQDLDSVFLEIKSTCYENEKVFKPNEEIREIALFYSDSGGIFVRFSNIENHDSSLLNFMNSFRKDKANSSLEDKLNHSETCSINDCQNKVERYFSDFIGFSKQIDIGDDNKRQISIIELKSADLERSIIFWSISSIKEMIWEEEVKKNCLVIKRDDQFDQRIKENVLPKDIAYSSDDATYYASFITDKEIRDEYQKKIDGPTKTKGNFFAEPTFVLKDGFSFNCKLQLAVKKLNPDELVQEVDKYRRSDGQYVYQSIFYTREELSEIIEKTLVKVQLEFSFKVEMNKESIIVVEEKL